jgi:hypothetical protein
VKAPAGVAFAPMQTIKKAMERVGRVADRVGITTPGLDR